MNLNDVDSILKWDILTLSTAFKRQTVSPVEVVDMIFERIEQLNVDLNIYTKLYYKNAVLEAEKAEKDFLKGKVKGLLHGITIGLDDNICTKEIKENSSNKNANLVTTLKNQGVIFTGKLSNCELTYKPKKNNLFSKNQKRLYNSFKISNESAVAVASYLCHSAIGIDSGGSIRITASSCGIVGMKPTYELINNDGIRYLDKTIDSIGLMTRNIMDNALLLNYLHNKKVLPKKHDNIDYTANLNEGLEGTIIGLPISPYFENVEKEVKEKVFLAIKKFESLGAKIKKVDLSENYLQILEASKFITRNKNNFLNNEYLHAQNVKRDATNYYNEILKEVDVLITPTLSVLPPAMEISNKLVNNRYVELRPELTKFTCPTNLLGLPSLSMPCGFSDSGSPIGIQLIGRKFDEASLYRFGYAFEQNKRPT